jgi:hypothetical protein
LAVKIVYDPRESARPTLYRYPIHDVPHRGSLDSFAAIFGRKLTLPEVSRRTLSPTEHTLSHTRQFTGELERSHPHVFQLPLAKKVRFRAIDLHDGTAVDHYAREVERADIFCV